MTDNISSEVKAERLSRMVAVFRDEAEKLHRQQIGSHQLVLVEGVSNCFKLLFSEVSIVRHRSKRTFHREDLSNLELGVKN